MPLPSDDTTPPVTTMILAMAPPGSASGLAEPTKSLETTNARNGTAWSYEPGAPRRRGRRGAAALERRELLGRVHARERPLAHHHLDAHPALERAELLEPLGLLEPSRRPRRELQQQPPAESIHAGVPE